MADPLRRPLKWSKHYQIYAEKHNVYGVFGELLKQIIIDKPDDPLEFIRDKLPSIAKGINAPRILLVGESGKKNAKQIAQALDAKYITIDDVMKNADIEIQESLLSYLSGEDDGNDEIIQTLCGLVKKRITAIDCESRGYVLLGFPLCKRSAILGQQEGILPKNVYIFLPDTTATSGGNGDPEQSEQKAANPPEGRSSKATKSAPGVVQVTESMLALRKAQHNKYLEIAKAYRKDIVKIITADKIGKQDLLNDLLSPLLTLRPSPAPFIPRIIVLGAPSSGKTTVTNHICSRFCLVNVNWIDLIRGAARWSDEIADEAQKYLQYLTPMKVESVKKILSKRLGKTDCEKKGWVLEGFPQSKAHCRVLQDLCLEPNRVFVISCPPEKCLQRMEKKRDNVLKRHLNGFEEPSPVVDIDEGRNLLLYPYSKLSVQKRYVAFTSTLPDILNYFSKETIFVDGSLKPSEVRQFVEASVVRPPLPQPRARK